MTTKELKIYQKAYQLGMLNERRKHRGIVLAEPTMSAEPQSLVGRLVSFIRSGLLV